MAEILTATRTQVANNAAQKAHPAAFNRPRIMTVDTPATWSAANGDTAGTALVMPAGSRLMAGVVLSNAAGSASSTLSVGLRDNVTKTVIDATALLASAALNAAQTVELRTGTKVTNGQYYIVPSDAEVFLTFGGADPLANQAIRLEIGFVSP